MTIQRFVGKGATKAAAEADLDQRVAAAGVGSLEGLRSYDVTLYQGTKKVGAGSGADYTSALQQALEAAGLSQEVVASGSYKEKVAVAIPVQRPVNAASLSSPTYDGTTVTRYTTRM